MKLHEIMTCLYNNEAVDTSEIVARRKQIKAAFNTKFNLLVVPVSVFNAGSYSIVCSEGDAYEAIENYWREEFDEDIYETNISNAFPL